MSRQLQFGCKHCGQVITIVTQTGYDRVDMKVKDGKVYEHSGEIEIRCRKCNKAVAVLSIEQT